MRLKEFISYYASDICNIEGREFLSKNIYESMDAIRYYNDLIVDCPSWFYHSQPIKEFLYALLELKNPIAGCVRVLISAFYSSCSKGKLVIDPILLGDSNLLAQALEDMEYICPKVELKLTKEEAYYEFGFQEAAC